MTTILAIDPGPVESAYVLIDGTSCDPIEAAKLPNLEVREFAHKHLPYLTTGAVEMVASYGMAVGKDVFETCVWIGRFIEVTGGLLKPIVRHDVKLHHCHNVAAKDSNIAQALIDRFASGEPNRGKGTKAAPGWFYGFHDDIWQAYALAVLVADRSAATVVAS